MRKRVRDAAATVTATALALGLACVVGAMAAAWRGDELALWLVTGLLCICVASLASCLIAVARGK